MSTEKSKSDLINEMSRLKQHATDIKNEAENIEWSLNRSITHLWADNAERAAMHKDGALFILNRLATKLAALKANLEA